MGEEITWVQVLDPNKSDAVVEYWQRWFDSKNIPHSIRSAHKGNALFRGMTRKEHDEYMAIRGPNTHEQNAR